MNSQRYKQYLLISLEKSEIEDLVAYAVDTTVRSIRQSLKEEIVSEIVSELGIDQLKHEISSLETENGQLRKRLENQQSAINEAKSFLKRRFRKQIQHPMHQANPNEQFSRKNNIKAFGLPEKSDENLFDSFSAILREKGGVTIRKEDVVAIHRIDHPDKSIIKPVLVKLGSSDVKMRVVKARKQLREVQSVRIADDVTRTNVMLINRLKAHPDIVNAWYFNARVFGSDNTGKRYKFYPFDSIESAMKK